MQILLASLTHVSLLANILNIQCIINECSLERLVTHTITCSEIEIKEQVYGGIKNIF